MDCSSYGDLQNLSTNLPFFSNSEMWANDFVKNKIQSYWVKYKYWEAAALQLREGQLGGATTTEEPKTL